MTVYCLYCKKKVPQKFDVCPNCGTPIGDDKPYDPKNPPKDLPPLDPADKPAPLNPADYAINRTCKCCGSTDVDFQLIAENEKRGCGTALLYALLLCIPVIGWVALILLLLGQESNLITYAVCQNCAYTWKVK